MYTLMYLTFHEENTFLILRVEEKAFPKIQAKRKKIMQSKEWRKDEAFHASLEKAASTHQTEA